MRHAYANTYGYRNGHSDGNGDSDSYRHSDCDGNSDRDGHGNSYGYCNAYGYGDRAAEAVTDAEAAAYTAASSIALVGFLKAGTRDGPREFPACGRSAFLNFARSALGVRCVVASLSRRQRLSRMRPVIEERYAERLATRTATLFHAPQHLHPYGVDAASETTF